MNSSLEIITDQNGYFRHPNNYPLVVIFDSKHGKDKAPDEISWQDPVLGLHAHELQENTGLVQSKKAKADTQPLKFVNVSHPVLHDKRTKRCTRTHITQDLQRRKQEHKSSVDKPFDVESISTHNATLCKKKKTLRSNSEVLASQVTSIPRQPFALLDPFATFPVNMEPYMYMLIHRYLSLTSKFSKSSELGCGRDLAKQGWLPLAMTDPALFHSILCGSALHMDLVMGRRECLEKFRHMKEAVHLLSARLQDSGSKLSDGTIAAVAHLAEFECIEGSFTNWSLHMDGLYKMVQIRGGFLSLNDHLRAKVWRADISGCVGTLSKPRFTATDIYDLSLPLLLSKQPIPALCDGLRSIVELFTFDDDLIGILGELQYLTSVLNNATVDLQTIDRNTTSLQHQLLLFHSAGYISSQKALLEEACCIGALVYLKTIHRFHLCLHVGRPPGAVTDTAMVQKLKSCLDMPHVDTTQTRALLLWMTFIGSTAAAGTKDRAWFMARLVKIIMELKICSWEDARLSLVKFLWVDRIHENSCRDIWDEALVTVNVLFGGVIPEIS